MTRDDLLRRWLMGSAPLSRRSALRASALGGLCLWGCGASTSSSGSSPIVGAPIHPGSTGTQVSGTGGATTGTAGTSGGTTGSGGTDAGPFDAGIPPSCAPQPCPADENTLIIPLKDYSDLMPVGGSHVFVDPRYEDPLCTNDYVIVIQPAAGQFAALSASCTHRCCTVYFQGGFVKCPCHGSVFDTLGNVVAGPATQALPTLPVCYDGCTVFVQLK